MLLQVDLKHLKETALKKLNGGKTVAPDLSLEDQKPNPKKKITFQELASEAIVLATNKILKEKIVERAVQGSHEHLLTVSCSIDAINSITILILVVKT